MLVKVRAVPTLVHSDLSSNMPVHGSPLLFAKIGKIRKIGSREYRDLMDARGHSDRFLEQVYMHKWVHSALDHLSPPSLKHTGTRRRLANRKHI